jgi:zinc/manganese transport system substrate-binding protein
MSEQHTPRSTGIPRHAGIGARSELARRPRAARSLTALVAGLGLVLGACSGASDEPSGAAETPEPSAAASGQVQVVATTSIVGELVAMLLQDDGEVRVLMGSGVDPHGYQGSAADAAAMREADLVVANGLQLEEGLDAMLAAAVVDGVRVLTLADKLAPIAYSAGSDDVHDVHDVHSDHDGHSDHSDDDHSDHDDDHDDHSAGDDHAGHDHGDEDPHFWFDPLRSALAVELIAAELALVNPDVDWTERAASVRTELEALDVELEALFAAIPAERRRIVTNHDSLGYLADRYGFEVIATVIPGSTTLATTNARDFAALIDLVIREGIDVVFAENTDSTALADQLASEAVGRSDVRIDVVRIYTDALGAPGTGAETYVGMLRATAELIHAALAAA